MFSLILPTYNERDNIAPFVEALIRQTPRPFEIIIVDDDSPDRTWEVAQALEQRFKEVRLIRRRGKKGLVASLNEGFSSAKGDRLLWMDADFSMPPEVVPRLVSFLESFPVVIGSRYAEGGEDLRNGFFPVLASRWLNRFAYRLLGDVRDYTSGFVATRREVLEQVGLSGRYGESCIRFLYKAKQAGHRVKEVPYLCRPRRAGRTKTFASPWKAFSYGKDYLWTVLSLWIKR